MEWDANAMRMSVCVVTYLKIKQKSLHFELFWFFRMMKIDTVPPVKQIAGPLFKNEDGRG